MFLLQYSKKKKYLVLIIIRENLSHIKEAKEIIPKNNHWTDIY